MYCYDECSDCIDENHSNECLCRINFKGNNYKNKNIYMDTRNAIINHYEKTNLIKKIYTNYLEYIKKNYNEKFTYNFFYYLSFFEDNKNFKISNNYDIIGYSDNYVMNLIIRPQFNILNFYDTIFNAIFNDFILKNNNESHKSFHKFNNKKIITCIISLDCDLPIFYEFNLDKNNQIIRNCIKEFLFQKYKSFNKNIFDFYIFRSKKIIQEIDKLKNINTIINENEYSHLPEYIKYFFHDSCTQIEFANKYNIDTTLNCLNIEETFFNEINKYLEKAINQFIDIDIINNLIL